jgi:peptidoglycan/LPS O-acetylase OafA/YrhL
MGARSFAYQPALDGVRAVSIAVVLVFHLGAPWMPGGYLGVSVFFTLSGFLITSLLLEERATTGRIGVGAFYVRRLRRLLPASLLCLLLIALAAAVGLLAERTDLRAGILAALAQVANWEALLGDRSYADLFLAPSPVDHFWSLAIEEQFYWLWPVAVLGITGLAARRGGHRTVTAVLVGLFLLLSAGAVLTARWWSADAAYFASWARFAEILAGAALAAVVAGRRVPAAARHLAPACLAVILVLAAVTPSGRGWAYAGGLPLFSLVSAGLVLGLQVDGPLRRVLSTRPFVATGLVSYGLYLFHWPVFTILDAHRTGLDGLPLATVRMAVTVAVTLASYRLLEQPVRARRILADARRFVGSVGLAAPALAAAVIVLVPVLAEPGGSPTAEPVVIRAATPTPALPSFGHLTPTDEELAAWAPAPDGTLPAPPPPVQAQPIVAAAPDDRPPTVAVFGDSVADWLLIRAMPTFDRHDLTLIDAAQAACDGIVDLPPGRDRHGKDLRLPDGCRPWTESYPPVLEDPALPVDVAALVLGQAPTVDRYVDGRWISPCEGIGWYLQDLEERVRYVRRHAGEAVLVLPSWGGERATWSLPDDHPARFACIRTELELFARRKAIRTVDLAEVLCPDGPLLPCTDRHEIDGTHVDPEDSPFVLDWLLDRLLRR